MGASAEEEIGRLLIRLVGDPKQFVDSMKKSAEEATKAAESIEKSAKKVEKFSGKVSGFAGNAVKALGAIGLATSLGAAYSKFDDIERNAARLNIAIEANGKNVKDTVEEYKKFTESITDTTLATKGQIAALIQQGEIRGLSTENTKKAVRDSVALAAALGGEASEYMRAAIGLQTHQFHALKHIPALRGIKDESKMVAQYQKYVTLGMKQAAAETETSTGKLEKLKRTLGALGVEIGGMVAAAIQPFVGWLEKAAKWFKELDPAVKKTVTVIALLLLGISAISPILTALAPTLAVIGTLVGIVFSPWILLIAPVAAGIAMMVNKLGGLAKTYEYLKQKAIDAWEWTKQKAQEFWDWFQPVWQAMQSFAVAVWEAIVDAVTWAWDTVKELASDAWDYIEEVFGGIMEESGVTWDKVRDGIRDAFIFAEWTVRNFAPIVKWLWVGAKYEAVRFFNQVEYFFKDVIPAVLAYFKDNWTTYVKAVIALTVAGWLVIPYALYSIFKAIDWGKLWEGFKVGAKAVMTWYIDYWKWIFKNFHKLVVKGINLFREDENRERPIDLLPQIGEDIKKKIKDAMGGKIELPPLTLPERVAGELEKSLKEEFDRLGAGLGQSWQEFREKKLAEFAEKGIPPDVLKMAHKGGEDLGKSYASGASKEIKKLDAVVLGSAESFAKIMAYQDRLSGLKDAKANTATDAKSAAGLAKQDKANQLLQDIRDNLKDAPKVNIGAGGDLT